MRRATAALALMAMLVIATFVHASEWIAVSSDQVSEPTVVVLESNDSRTVIEYELTGYFAETLEIDGREHVVLTLPGQARLMEAGLPDLPSIRQSIIVPDDGQFAYRIIEAEYSEETSLPVAPSKGHFTRDIDPATRPYIFDSLYGESTLYPAQTVVLHDPYILRDFRGMVVEVSPIQYNPALGTLRVARRLVVEITRVAPGGVNVKDRLRDASRVSANFDNIYRDHFLNYGDGLRYDPIPEPGNLLIITYDAFHADVMPLVEWKQQKGTPVEIVDLSTIGSTSSQIKAYIDLLYAQPESLTYVILIGDKQQVPTMIGTAEGADSDPCYAKCEGGDHYPDLFISRMSAQNSTQVQTQIAKAVNYEKYPDEGVAGVWYHMGVGVASAEGSPPDYTRCGWLRDMLMDYTYAYVDEIYDPGASSSQVTTALNQGRSVLNYIGHGSGTSWSTTGFSNSNVHALSNVGMWPWIIDVACMNGDIGLSECFAEAWLRAGTPAEPTGAVGMYSASTNASWVPPCDMQSHCIELLTTEQRNSLGGILFNGVMHAMDVNPGYEGIKLMEQYLIFGDCSMSVRSAAPADLDMQHLGVLLVGMSTYDVTVTSFGAPLEGALVCGRNEAAGLYAYGYTDASGVMQLDFGIPASGVGTLELTATAYNCLPDFDTAMIVPPDGAYCIFDSYEIDDDGNGTSSGNGDGLPDAGEQIELVVTLTNVGNELATGVTATLTENSDFVSITDDYEEFGDVPAGGTAASLDDFDFSISGSCPDGHAILFTLEATDGIDTWTSVFSITIGAPMLMIQDVAVNDPPNGGNGNGCAEAGETVTMTVTLGNAGSRDATNVEGRLMSVDEYVVIEQAIGTATAVPGGGGTMSLSPDFVVRLLPDVPAYHEVIFRLHCTADGGVSGVDTFSFIVGSAELETQFEQGEELWSHAVVTSGADDWHLENYRSSSPSYSWKHGGLGAGIYSNNSDGGLLSPLVCLGTGAELEFEDWLDAEQQSGTYAWDCCVVEISTDQGESWEIITPVGGYSHMVYSSSSVPLPTGTPCWSGSHGWRHETFELAAYENTMAQFRFRFMSDGSVQEEGWYIDDVVVSSAAAGMETVVLSPAPFDYTLGQNTPNPFNPVTTIEYALPHTGVVSLRIYNIAGRLVRTLVHGVQESGYQSATWNGTNDLGQKVSSGVYLYHLQAGTFTDQRTMVLIK